MSRLIHRYLFATASLLVILSAETIAPAAAQNRAPGTPDGFGKIDGTTLKPAILSYDATVETGGRSRDLSSTQIIRATSTRGIDTWTFVNKIKTGRGTVTDSLIAHRRSLLPLERHQDGGSQLHLTYRDTTVSGKMASGGESVSIDERVEAPTLAGGVHDVIAVGAMPLTPGFQAALRVFSPQDRATKRANFKVTGTETVQTPAGTFDTYVVDLNVGEGYVTGRVYLRQEAPHYYVKWMTEVNAGQSPRTITQTLSSMTVEEVSKTQ